MIEEKLEILLITYNRYTDLENTLKQFSDGPFSRCKITILDNCSDDKTQEICVKYQNIFPNMIFTRHSKNIGGNANILRAVETSISLYTWVICDDDSYDFSDCSDIIKAVDSEKYDLISPGSPGEQEWERGLSTSVKKLVEMGSCYFFSRSFIPGTIFKTELFDSICLVEGYANVHNFFPYFPFINKSFEEDFSIFYSKKNIIIPGTHNLGSYSNVYFHSGWINSCSLIKDKKIRKKTVYSIKCSGRPLISRIFVSITWDKMVMVKKFRKNILSLSSSIISTFGFSIDVLIILFILPVSVIPSFMFKFFLRLYIYLIYGINGKARPSELDYLFADNKSFDPLREY